MAAVVVQEKLSAPTVQSASVSDPIVPLGIGSVITTPAGSIDGPLFVSVIVYVVEVPAEIEATPSVLAIARSAAAVTVVLWLAVLLAGTGSGVVDDAVAVSVISPSIVVVTMMATVTAAPLAIVPTGHDTTPAACEQLPWLGTAETNVTEPGSVSVTTTPVASDGPRFVTVTAYVTLLPATTGSTRSVFVIVRSAADVTASVSVAALSVGSVSTIGVEVIVAVLTSVAAA